MIKRSQQGFLAIVAVVIILIFGFIGVIATYLINTDVLEGANDLGATQALFLADSGLEGAAHQITLSTIANRTTCANITGNGNLTNYTITGAAGPLTVTGALQSPTASTLNGALSANATSVVLNNASSYATNGFITIDNETMSYMGVSGNTLLNVKRGVDGTTAAAHVNAAPVGQYQCLLTSQGGAPTLNPAGNTIGGMRTEQEDVQLQEGWLVGASGAVDHWNRPTENSWNSAPISGVSGNLNAVFALSNADAWIVGNAGVIEHWNGNTWSATASGTARNLNGIFCTASNNCETVGSNNTILVWNGSAWSAQASGQGGSTQFNSVYCTASNNCWAVGNTQSSNDTIIHWNGATWSSSTATGTQNNLNDVWCTSSSNCWAVGASRTFVFYNGSTWTTQNAAAFPAGNYAGVTCNNAGDCWAVGPASNTVHWNGSAWSTVASATTNTLTAVSCSNANNCWAVGTNAATVYWNGSVWTVISNPSGSTALAGVTLIGPNTQSTAAWLENFHDRNATFTRPLYQCLCDDSL